MLLQRIMETSHTFCDSHENRYGTRSWSNELNFNTNWFKHMIYRASWCHGSKKDQIYPHISDWLSCHWVWSHNHYIPHKNCHWVVPLQRCLRLCEEPCYRINHNKITWYPILRIARKLFVSLRSKVKTLLKSNALSLELFLSGQLSSIHRT